MLKKYTLLLWYAGQKGCLVLKPNQIKTWLVFHTD